MPTYEKANVITDHAARDHWLLSGSHKNRCAVCWRPWERAGWRGFAVHHLVRGANGRSDEPCNLLLLCADHHDHYHGAGIIDSGGQRMPELTFGMLLRIKMESSEWDEKRLTALYHKRLPDMKPLPAYYLKERERYEKHH